MLTLAGEVYGRQETLGDNKRDPLAYEKGYDNTHLVSTPAAARGWHPVSALELGMKPADFGDHGNTKYAFTDGVYAAYTAGGAKLVGTLKGDISEANAMVLTGMVGGTKTLVVTFRGTDQFADFDDYPDFATHYKKFEPLVDGIREYLKGNPVGQVLVSGHSLGAGMVEHFLADFSGDTRFRAFTAGSPGSDTGRADGRITNFVSTDDAIGWVPEFSGAQLKAFGAAVASLVAGKDPVFAAKLLLFLAPLKGKDRSGADVEINSSVRDPLSLNFKGLNPKTLVDEHAHTLYTSNILKLITFAEDQGGPFSGTKLAQKLLAGEIVPEKNALQIGLGKPTNPKVVGSTFDPKIVAPLTDDNYVLGNNGQNDTFILTKKTLIQTVGRKFDGGTGDGDLVRVPYKLKGVKGDGDVFRVVDNSDGSKTLKYDAKRGKTDKWETVGTFYRTEKIVYGKGDPEKLNDVTKAKSASADHDLMFT